VPEPGLRERKKRLTKQSIADSAFALFAEYGFDKVTVAQIARQAGVSEATVFNYFPAKEDLVYFRMEAFEDGLLTAIRRRPAGRSIVDAFRDHVLGMGGLMSAADNEATAGLRAAARIVADSPALQARERQIYDQATGSLAGLIRSETSRRADDIQPWVAANALVGVHRAVVSYVREQILSGASVRDVRRRVRRQAERALAALTAGLPDVR